MRTDTLTMESFAESVDGRGILSAAHSTDAWHIVQRIAPVHSKDNPEGAYLILLLNWPAGIITRMIFNGEEVQNFAAMIQVLANMSVFDAFDMEGVKPV